MARDCVLVLLLLCTICSVSVQANTPDILKLNGTLSGEANKKLQEVFEMMKSKNWMERLVKAISAQKIKMDAKKPQETAEEKLEDAIEQFRQQAAFDQAAAAPARRPAHRIVGKLNKQIFQDRNLQGLTDDELNDGFQLQRAKRSEPEDAYGHVQHATEATATTTTSAALTTSSNCTTQENEYTTTTTHLESTTPQEYDWGLLSCPEEFNHCVYGDCVGLGYDIYTCYCWDGYSGMSCELLEFDIVLLEVSHLGGSSDPATAALGSPSAYSAATAIAHYLAGDLQGFQ